MTYQYAVRLTRTSGDPSGLGLMHDIETACNELAAERFELHKVIWQQQGEGYCWECLCLFRREA